MHDPTTKYIFTVDVGIVGGKLRGTLGVGQCMQLWFAATLTCIYVSAVGQHYAEFMMALSISTPH